MLSGQCNKITVGDLIRAGHQIRPNDSIRRTQIIRDELVARISKQFAQDAERVIWCESESKQRM